jgi:dipeptidase D
MSNEILNLAPGQIWKNFYSLTQIPRPSKNEGRIIAFIRDFGENLKLETHVDGVGNVIIRKAATPGMENRKTVTLQTHLDMVPQKNSDTKHDFEKDPIDAYIDGEWVKARGTTLGSDNGMGVSAAMAVLESNEIAHGPIEALFTIDEETGMTGAFGIAPGMLKGEILLNLDSEDEGELYIGCAGGLDAVITLPYKEKPAPRKHNAFILSIKGLRGGHSGLDISLGRGNSNKLLCRFLYEASRKFGLRLSSFNGGNLRNAIPRESFATVMIPAKREKEFRAAVKEFAKIIKNEFQATEPDLRFEAAKSKKPKKVISRNGQSRLIRSIYACPNGVIRMSDGVPGLVETSNNLAIVKTEKRGATVCCLLRSSVDSAKLDLGQMIKSVFELAGANVELTGGYPGWKPNPDSPILHTMKKVYEDKYGKTPEVKAVHAGLECGLIGGIYPKMDMISFGPTIRFPHSPDEKVLIESVGKFWDYLVETLKNIPAK